MHIRMYVSMISVRTWGGQGGSKSEKCTYVFVFLLFRCSHGEGRAEGTKEMYERMCVSLISVLTRGGQQGRKSQKCTYVYVFL